MLWRWPNCMTIWHVMCSKRKRQRHHHDGDRAGGRGRLHLHPLRHPRALLQVRPAQPARKLLYSPIVLTLDGSCQYVAHVCCETEEKSQLSRFHLFKQSLRQIKWMFKETMRNMFWATISNISTRISSLKPEWNWQLQTVHEWNTKYIEQIFVLIVLPYVQEVLNHSIS